MSHTINIYADESCHLEHDKQRFMVQGAVWCPTHKSADVAKRLREFKARHKMPAGKIPEPAEVVNAAVRRIGLG